MLGLKLQQTLAIMSLQRLLPPSVTLILWLMEQHVWECIMDQRELMSIFMRSIKNGLAHIETGQFVAM